MSSKVLKISKEKWGKLKEKLVEEGFYLKGIIKGHEVYHSNKTTAGVTYDDNDGVIRYIDKIENVINRLVSSL